jgi:hypothetical protein
MPWSVVAGRARRFSPFALDARSPPNLIVALAAQADPVDARRLVSGRFNLYFDDEPVTSPAPATMRCGARPNGNPYPVLCVPCCGNRNATHKEATPIHRCSLYEYA